MSVQYRLTPIPFTAVTIEDTFWQPRIETNRAVTIPYNFQKCEETGRIDNFAKAAGLMAGPHEGRFYNDSDVFKVVEGAAYSLSLYPDAELDRYLDALIAKIAGAQEADGYLYTARTINPAAVSAEVEGLTRWSNLRVNHELYNVGHLYEAAVAHFQATGKRALLDVALKNADLIERVFGPDKRRDVPGHQEIEIGLVKLYRVSGEEKYLRLAKFFLDERGHANGRELYENHSHIGYMQDHKPVIEQDEAVGHAVRAAYMYTGMADVAALTGDAAYVKAIDRIWENVVTRKLYLTGGIGALHQGEAFGANYELPNATAYTETCAAIANILWNQRMFMLHGQAKYIDVLERTLYNGFLAGVSLSGDTFFYPNPLAAGGQWAFNKGATGRSPWFDCSCCPTNVARFIPSLPGYVYAQGTEGVYVNLFVAGRGKMRIGETDLAITQETRYPWYGQVRLIVEPDREAEFSLFVRLPGWARNRPVPGDLYRYLDRQVEQIAFNLNDAPTAYRIVNDFAQIRRAWQPGDVLDIHLPMPVRRVVSHLQVGENAGKVALERGPLVYCFEGVDNGGHIDHLRLNDEMDFQAERRPELLRGLTVVRSGDMTAIPYYAWAHREAGQMAVWLPQH
jgi:hypothetical protein